MNHQFSLKIDPIMGTGHILLNNQSLFSQSQLQICTTQNFFDWYRELPALMFAEVNDNYSVSVECLDSQYELLCAVFATVGECQCIRHIPMKMHYSIEQRFSWLNEAASKMSITLPEIPKYSIQTGYASNPDDISIQNSLPAFYRKHCANSLCQVNIWLAQSVKLSTVPANQVTDNDIILCEDSGISQVQLSRIPIFHQSREKWNETITRWIDLMILMPYLVFCQESLIRRLNKASFDVVSRVRMLTREAPYVNLRIPARLECGTSGNIALDEFPQSTLSLRISNTDVLTQQNGKLFAKKAGRSAVAVLSGDGQVLQEKDMEVYFVPRVTSIALSSSKGNSILLGDTFTIRADCQPQGAVNVSKAVWSATPSNALNHIGGGRFTALSPGKCTVTLTIEKVSQDFSLTVIPLPNDIRLPSEIRLKVNATPQRVSAALHPSGSACKEIRCKVGDGSIAQWNPNTKSVVPISEGSTVFEATAIGPSGNVLFTKRCAITILPENDIITPPTLLTLAACFAILALLTAHTSFGILSLLSCLILCGAASIINGIPWVKHIATQENKNQTIIGIIGAVISLLILIALV